MNQNTSKDTVTRHFTDRAERYNKSSHWCTDPVLAERVLELAAPKDTDQVLDVACGTGLVSRLFKGRTAKVTGLDLTRAMYEQARPHLDELVAGSAEAMPFEDATFDLVVCRQGIQFMNDAAAVSEMARVTRPGGRVVLIHLCAYGESDREEYFEILKQRNPARRNFYLREDLAQLIANAGYRDVQVHDHISPEDVDIWSDNGAIPEDNREAIRQVYRNASPAFQELHANSVTDSGRIIDNMLFGIGVGVR